jgi:hypothetical protein
MHDSERRIGIARDAIAVILDCRRHIILAAVFSTITGWNRHTDDAAPNIVRHMTGPEHYRLPFYFACAERLLSLLHLLRSHRRDLLMQQQRTCLLSEVPRKHSQATPHDP